MRVLQLAGFVAIAVGIGLYSAPAGLIAAGAFCVLIGEGD